MGVMEKVGGNSLQNLASERCDERKDVVLRVTSRDFYIQ